MILGLKRGTIELMPYQAEWATLFEDKKCRLWDAFGNDIQAIAHIGSTSIVGIAAKPILDLAIGVSSLDDGLTMQPILEELGYTFRHHRDDEVFYAKGSEDKRTHYAHVVVFGGIVRYAFGIH